MGFGVGAAEINIVSKRFVLSRGFWRKVNHQRCQSSVCSPHYPVFAMFAVMMRWLSNKLATRVTSRIPATKYSFQILHLLPRAAGPKLSAYIILEISPIAWMELFIFCG
jgi:hypothetical protein